MTTAVARKKKTFLKTVGSILMVGALGATLVAQTAAATRYDNQIIQHLSSIEKQPICRGRKTSRNMGLISFGGLGVVAGIQHAEALQGRLVHAVDDCER